MSASARKINAAILRAVHERTQVRVAEALGIDSSTLGRWLDSEHLARCCALLDAVRLKVVPEGTHDYSPDDIGALAHLAQRGLAVVLTTTPPKREG